MFISKQTHNVVLRSQYRTSKTQHCSNADTTTPEFQRCFNVALTFASKINSQCTMNVVLTTLLQR